MTIRPLLRPAFCLALMIAGLAWVTGAQAGPTLTDVIQVVADLTLIDGACQSDVVNFGVVFRFAELKGVPEIVVMPGGSRRSEFEAALRGRRARFDKEELCGEIAENYAEALPGSVSLPVPSDQR